MRLKYFIPAFSLLVAFAGCKQDECYCSDDDPTPAIDFTIEEEPVKEFKVGDTYFKMVGVPSGSFFMGAQSSDPDGDNYSKSADQDAGPVHKVYLTGYYIGETEVTQGLWNDLLGTVKTGWVNYSTVGKYYPVFLISYTEAVEDFLPALNKYLHDDGQLPENMEFVLPTEAQWEYAARGGAKSKGTEYPGSNDLSEVAYYDSDYYNSSYVYINYVKTRKPNELGLYDMAGNVAEWCYDYYSSDYYKNSPSTNPTGPKTSSYSTPLYVNRGGGYDSYAENLTVFARRGIAAGNVTSAYSRYNGGLRLCLVMKGDE